MTVIHARSHKNSRSRVSSTGAPVMARPGKAALTDPVARPLPGRRVRSIGRQSGRSQRQLAARSSLPLNERQEAALALVTAAQDGVSTKDVMDALGISRSSAAGVLRALVLRELVDYRNGCATLKTGGRS